MQNIVIIEDESGLRESLLEGLEGAIPDATFMAYGSVEEAMADIEAKPPPLVISDIQLPGQSGVDFLLTAKQRWPGTRFILITAYATLVTHEKAGEYGAFRLLRKPFALKELVKAIQEALGANSVVSASGSKKRALCLVPAQLSTLAELDGFLCVCLVDSNSGKVLEVEGNRSERFDLAAAGNTNVVRAERKIIETLGLQDRVEDILITLKKQYHLIRLVNLDQELFLYLVLDRARSNLGLSRHVLQEFSQRLESGADFQTASL